jgi:uncharacterized spore protein YtfJ
MVDFEKPAVEQSAAAAEEDKKLSANQVIENTIDKFMSAASVEAVFGKPVRQGDTVIITAAEVACGFGFGVGEGAGQDGDQKGGGSGGGGGGQVFSRPVAVVVCTPSGVSIQPVLDRTKLWLAALTALGFMLATLAKMKRAPRG